jgi:hypothetical protein
MDILDMVQETAPAALLFKAVKIQGIRSVHTVFRI